MHVHAVTVLPLETVRARFAEAGRADTGSSPCLIYANDRTPPKFFLLGAPVIPPASAEVSVTGRSDGTDVVLRLMWGPLPAPFPRALAVTGIVLGLLILLRSDNATGNWWIASLLILMPLTAMLHQLRGERELQRQLSRMLDGATFTPRPH